jgi:hypothetical protein
MADILTISTPKYSFYQFPIETEGGCYPDPHICLPVQAGGDIQFQFFIYATGTYLSTLLYGVSQPGQPGAAEIAFYLVPYDEACNINSIAPSYLTTEIDYSSRLIVVADSTVIPDQSFLSTAVLANGQSVLENWSSGQCFSIMAVYKLYGAGGSQTNSLIACSNCFRLIASTSEICFSTLLEYNQGDNAFGWYFNYSGLPERVRLPLYLHSPIQVEIEDSYERSDGSTQQLSYRVWKDYKLKTDYWPEDWHESFNFITAFDNVLYSGAYPDLGRVQFVRKEKIELNWVEEEMPFFQKAQGKTTVRMAAPRANVNSNCT